MKKLFHNIQNEHGFILPYSLILSMLAISTLFTAILLYENEQIMTKRLLEQLQIETMAQMGEVLIETELDEVDVFQLEGKIYSFPYGTVHVETVGQMNYFIEIKLRILSESLTYPYYISIPIRSSMDKYSFLHKNNLQSIICSL